MVGSGVFLLPASLGAYGGISIIGWLITTAGAMLLALMFSRLSRMVPKAGGPYAYTRRGLGDFAGFLVAWGSSEMGSVVRIGSMETESRYRVG